MNPDFDYISKGLVGVEENLSKAALYPIGQALELAISLIPLGLPSDSRFWLEKLAQMSRNSQSSGKRFRAKLALASSQAIGLPIDMAINLGAFVEMIQSASLIHDDVVDEASLRRNEPTVNSLMGNRFAVLTGDYVLSLALTKLGELKNHNLTMRFSEVVSQMTFGEAMEIEITFNHARTIAHYLTTISLKTASLLSFCCQSTCLIANVNEKTINSLAEFGANLGMAFQLIDDTLDFIGPDGKEKCQDFKEGLLTLPILLLGIQGNPFDKSIDEIQVLIAEKNTLAQTIDKAREYSVKAIDCLDGIKNLISERCLQTFIDINTSIYERLPNNLNPFPRR